MKNIRIILVENDEDEQFFMEEGFNASGLYQIVQKFPTGDELLEWMEQHPEDLPDVILSDLNMPGKNGYDIISETRSRPEWNAIPVIITSTSSTKSIMDKCLQLGAAAYVVKPETFISYKEYAKKLYELIEEKKLVVE